MKWRKPSSSRVASEVRPHRSASDAPSATQKMHRSVRMGKGLKREGGVGTFCIYSGRARRKCRRASWLAALHVGLLYSR